MNFVNILLRSLLSEQFSRMKKKYTQINSNSIIQLIVAIENVALGICSLAVCRLWMLSKSFGIANDARQKQWPHLSIACAAT